MDIVVPEEYRYLYETNDERPVIKIPDPVLRQKAAEISRVNNRVKVLADSMLRSMKRAHGIGLAAPQIGVLERIVIVSPDNRPMVLINPEIIESEGSIVAQEGCLSLPGLYGDVERAEAVAVRAMDRRGRMVTYEMEGLAARVTQHEIDHLDGVLFVDKADPATLHWEHPPHERRAASE